MTSLGKLKQKLRGGSRLSTREVRRLLRELGYSMERRRGSHEQWVRQGRSFTLACHDKEAPRYILDLLLELLEDADGQD